MHLCVCTRKNVYNVHVCLVWLYCHDTITSAALELFFESVSPTEAEDLEYIIYILKDQLNHVYLYEHDRHVASSKCHRLHTTGYVAICSISSLMTLPSPSFLSTSPGGQ